jgi:hypothetical protein
MSSEQKYIMSIGFSRPKDWKPVAEAIMGFEDTDFSHVFVTWKCTNIDRRKVYEAVGSGSRKISNTRFKEANYVVDIFQFEISCDDLFKIDQMTHDQAGTPYGYKHLLGLMIMRVQNYFHRLLKTGKRTGNPFKDGNYSQICVEAGAYVVELAEGIDMPGDIEDYGLKEFYDFVSKHGRRVKQEKLDRINGVNKAS